MASKDGVVGNAGPVVPHQNNDPQQSGSSKVNQSKQKTELKYDVDVKQDIALKQNVTAGLRTFGPKFWTHGSRYTVPIARTKNFTKVLDQLDQIKRIVQDRYQAKQKRRAEANEDWGSYFKLLGTRRTISSMGRELRSLNDLKVAAEACEINFSTFSRAEKHLRRLRRKSIPRDEGERNRFFDELTQAAEDVKAAGKNLDKALSNLRNQANRRKWRIFWSRSWLRAPFRRTSRYKHIDDVVEGVKWVAEHMLTTQDRRKQNIPQQMDAEIDRIDELKRRIDDAAHGQSGQDALDNVLGRAHDRARLRASVALQALRCGEPLSPRLKHALNDNAYVPDTWDVLAKGNFNWVYKAKLRFRGQDGKETEGDYALKRLDARITIPHGIGTRIGLADRRVGVFARHCAANEISAAMGMDLVGKPEIIELLGHLYMALPLVKGYDAVDIQIAMGKAGGTQVYNKVAEALHRNPNFQNLCKEIQLFNVFTGDPDTHGCNVKFRFINPDTKKEVTPEQMAQMDPRDISALEVEAGLIDQDMAFAPMGTIRQDYRDPVWKKFPKRWRYLGPPPFHTNVDRERTDKLLKNLETGPLSREMRWHLINDGSPDHDEFAALKTRTAALKKHMDEDPAHRLDANTGQYLNRHTSEPYGPKNMQRHMSDMAPKVMHGPTSNRVSRRAKEIRASNVHKYMGLKKTR